METRFQGCKIFVIILFKSYYVVWKPGLERYYFLFRYLFKSYYVVWKLFAMFIIIITEGGLNRTM